VRGLGGRPHRRQRRADHRLHGTTDQQWELNSDLTISSVVDPTLCLASPENAWGVVLETCVAGMTSQQWKRA